MGQVLSVILSHYNHSLAPDSVMFSWSLKRGQVRDNVFGTFNNHTKFQNWFLNMYMPF